MTGRIIDISTAGTHLSIKHDQMVVELPDVGCKTVPLEDISMVVLNHPAISLTQSVPTRLAENKAALLFCGRNQMPVGLSLPFEGNTLQGARLRQQLSASATLVKRLWQAIIKCKIQRQGDVLQQFCGDDAGLLSMGRRVKSGDKGNLEAQAAQRYWPRLMGKNFKRERYGAPPNHLLNYGYAVTRAAVARSLCISGLHPGIGLFHSNRSNSFPLADDILEVFRPMIDLRVRHIITSDKSGDLTADHKARILSLLNEPVAMPMGELPLHIAIQNTCASLAQSFEAQAVSLNLPIGINLGLVA